MQPPPRPEARDVDAAVSKSQSRMGAGCSVDRVTGMPTTWGWRVVVIASILVVFGNAAGVAADPNVVTVSWAAIAESAGTLLIVIVASRWCGLTWAEAGIGRTNLLRSSLIGAAIGLGLAAVLLLALEVGAQLGTPITYQPLRGVSIAAVLTHALVGLPLQTAIPEELAFRGLVLGLLMRKLTPLRATLVTSAIFVAWHVVVQVQTLAVTNFHKPVADRSGHGPRLRRTLRRRSDIRAPAFAHTQSGRCGCGPLVVRCRFDYRTVFPDPLVTPYSADSISGASCRRLRS